MNIDHSVKLIKIHKRRWEILKIQAERQGDYTPPHVISEILAIEEQVRGLIEELRRRLQLLKEKKAIQGLNSDPSVDIEIEDIEKILSEVYGR